MAQILELRVHGVSNTSPAEILCMEKSDTEDPHPTRVAGDATTGFYRESARDPTAGLTTEAYSWGQLTSGARAAKDIERALWTVLLPFTLANIALPARTGIPADPVTERWSSRAGIAAWLIRLFCLSLTGTLILAATGIGVDLIAWQCVDAACLRRIPGSWEFLSTGWWGSGARSLALGLLVPLAMLAVIGRLTWRTYQYEAELPAGPAGAPNTAPPANPLQDPTFWCGEGQVRRAAVLHLCAGVSVAAAVPLAAVLHMDPPQGARAVLAWGTVALFAVPALITLIALGQPYLTRRPATPRSDRGACRSPCSPGWGCSAPCRSCCSPTARPGHRWRTCDRRRAACRTRPSSAAGRTTPCPATTRSSPPTRRGRRCCSSRSARSPAADGGRWSARWRGGGCSAWCWPPTGCRGCPPPRPGAAVR